jgi:hypothetical protein
MAAPDPESRACACSTPRRRADRLACVLPSPALPPPGPMRRKWSRVICSPWPEDAPGGDGQASRYRLRWIACRAQPDRFNRAVGSGDDQARNSAGRATRLTSNCPSGQLHASILSPFMGVCITQGPIRPWQRSRSCRPVVGLLLGGATTCAPKS